MANTLKLGNGNWATKEDSLLAYNDENGNFKPLPFDFTRASSATVVNKAGLIETVQSGVPRIDYTDANGALKLEPQRTNLITQSEAFDNAYWTKTGSSVASGFVSPSADSPLGAFKLVEDTSTGTHRLDSIEWIFITGGTTVTQSVYVKASGRTIVGLQDNALGAGHAVFNLSTVTVLEVYGVSAKIETLADGWFRISYTFVSGGAGSMPYKTGIYALDTYTSGTPLSNSYTGDGTSGLYIYGAQFEAGYATSYIPTQGSTVTRVADVCSQTPPVGVIGQTEGTLFMDVTLTSRSSFTYFAISPNLASSYTYIGIGIAISAFSFEVINGSVAQFAYNYGSTSTGRFRLALAYKSNDFVAYVNGVQVGSDASGTVPTCGQFGLNSYSNAATLNYNQAQLYNTRLSNSELATLTSL